MSKNQIYILVGGGCLLALCAVAALLSGILLFTPVLGRQINAPQATAVNPQRNIYPKADGNSMGDPNAPIQIVEFSDFQCPYCKRFHTQTEPLLISNYIETSKVYFTYRSAGNWVSGNIGGGNTESQDAAASAYCAADQGKFWEMHAALFANNRDVENQGAFSSAHLTSIAQSVGLDMKVFQNCFVGGRYTDRVQKDYQDAIAAGVQGTPSFLVTYQTTGVIRTFLIEGAQPYQAFQDELDKILQEMGQ
jgi:protein-disulfide isomerase